MSATCFLICAASAGSSDSVTVRMPFGRLVTVRVMRSWLPSKVWMTCSCDRVAASGAIPIIMPGPIPIMPGPMFMRCVPNGPKPGRFCACAVKA